MKQSLQTVAIVAILSFVIQFDMGCLRTTVKYTKTEDKYCGSPIEIVKFQGCQYVLFSCGGGSWGSHMGNCDNPIHISPIHTPSKGSQAWILEPYQYVFTMQDDNWITVRHSDGTLVGDVQMDTTSSLYKLLYKDNE